MAQKFVVNRDMNLLEVIQTASGTYRPGGSMSGPARNAVITTWAASVGRARAMAEVNAILLHFPSKSAAASYLKMSKSTLDKIIAYIEVLPDAIEDVPPGVSLYFGTVLTSVDRVAVEGLMTMLLGRDTNCRIMEFKVEGDSTFVRIDGGSLEELQELAEAIWDRVWRMEEKAIEKSTSLVSKVVEFTLEDVLDNIRDELECMELRILSDDALEMLEKQGSTYVKQEDQKLLQTWGQKMAYKAIEATKKKMFGKMSGVVDSLLENK